MNIFLYYQKKIFNCLKSLEKKIQNLTDSQILELEKKLKEKEKEIMTV